MTSHIFCPVCKRKNSADATQCAYCGSALLRQPQSFTTRQITKAPDISQSRGSLCADRLEKVSDHGIAFFIANEKEPVIIESFTQIFIGRQAQGTAVLSLDLTKYDGEEHGVSRQHAQIIHEDGVFTLIDLSSTNGTWLNQRRLTPGRPYQLHNDDQILVGQLPLTVCLHSDSGNEEVVFYLKDISLTKTQRLHLTPSYITKVIAPYLQAILEIQRVCEAGRGKTPRAPHINAISSMKSDSVIIVSMEGVADTIQLIQKWVIPWRKRSVDGIAPLLKGTGTEINHALNNLALRMLSDLAPTATQQEMNAYRLKFQKPLDLLATGKLVLST